MSLCIYKINPHKFVLLIEFIAIQVNNIYHFSSVSGMARSNELDLVGGTKQWRGFFFYWRFSNDVSFDYYTWYLLVMNGSVSSHPCKFYCSYVIEKLSTIHIFQEHIHSIIAASAATWPVSTSKTPYPMTTNNILRQSRGSGHKAG